MGRGVIEPVTRDEKERYFVAAGAIVLWLLMVWFVNQ